jgi:hypothetical protein
MDSKSASYFDNHFEFVKFLSYAYESLLKVNQNKFYFLFPVGDHQVYRIIAAPTLLKILVIPGQVEFNQ